MTDANAPAKRPRSIPELFATLARFRTDESMRRALAFRTKPSDAFIATYPKCGTTWMQQIVHGLRSNGSMAFAEITQVVPWLESAHDMGLDPEQQAWTPRALKTHFTWHEVPKGARYIYVIRNPADALVSFYYFFQGWMIEPGAISLDEFARELFFAGSKSGRYWDHLRSWWDRTDTSDTLFVCFEDMKDDLPAVVARVARFIGVPDDPERVDLAARQASFEFMSTHGRQFDDHLLRDARNAALGLPDGDTSKLRAGRVGDHARELSPALIRLLDETWREEIAAPLGIESYQALRERVARANAE